MLRKSEGVECQFIEMAIATAHNKVICVPDQDTNCKAEQSGSVLCNAVFFQHLSIENDNDHHLLSWVSLKNAVVYPINARCYA